MRKIDRKLSFLKLMAFVASVVFGFIGMVGSAIADDWPTKDITLIVPHAPGGGYDVLARTAAPFIEKHLPKKANVIVKNVIGAGGRIGLMETLKAKPDGHTIGIDDPLNVTITQIGGQLKGVDVLKISWLGRLDNLPYLLMVGIKSGFKSPADMRDKPVRFAVGDTSQALSTAVVAKVLGTESRIITYEGTGPANFAILQGDIDAFMVNWPSAMRMVRASEAKLIPLFVCEKVPELKEIPSAKDLGISFEKLALPLLRYSHVLYASPGLPPELKKMWDEILNKVFIDPEWLARMNKIGIPPSGLTGGKLSAIVTETFETTEKFKDILASLGTK